MLVRRIHVPEPWQGEDGIDREAWPYTIPAVAEIADKGLEFRRPVTFLVGENGSGKSTIVEAMAEAYDIDPRGGRGRIQRRRDPGDKSVLGRDIELEPTALGAKYAANRKLKSRSYFLRAETAFDFIEFISSSDIIIPGYWQDDLRVRSHGEGYMTVLRTILGEPGLYLLDEPESALSFASCLQMVGLLHDAGRAGAQIICATHSPVLAATPGADIVEVGEHGIRRPAWDELEVVDHWKRFLAVPDKYLRHIVDA
ncbi:putative ATPase [Nocardiopsis mwathae]|uniref:Putative ATPase n=1 Tax=Nocardiopsis mwathae TaxID=1472723 RepID=A0A7X0D659_9ACTN|nr:AAA family ATPase [Nocardiopsis mwathae]MBB6172983.1 putative ATPase [Nocardiopsis mwathae]